MKYLLKRKTNRLNKKEGKAWNEWIDHRIPTLHMEMMKGKEQTGQEEIGQELQDRTRMMMMKQEQTDEEAINQFWKKIGQSEPIPYSISSRPVDLKKETLKPPKVKIGNKFDWKNSCPPQPELTQDDGLVVQVDRSGPDPQSHHQHGDKGEVKDGEGKDKKKKRKNNKREEVESMKEKKEKERFNKLDFPIGCCVMTDSSTL